VMVGKLDFNGRAFAHPCPTLARPLVQKLISYTNTWQNFMQFSGSTGDLNDFGMLLAKGFGLAIILKIFSKIYSTSHYNRVVVMLVSSAMAHCISVGVNK